MKKHAIQTIKDYGLLIFMLVIGLMNLTPVIWSMITSVKPAQLTFSIPPVFFFKPTLEGYNMLFFNSETAIGINVYNTLINSIVVALTSTFLTLFIGCFAAFSLINFRFRFRKTISFAILATRMLPPIGTIIPFGNGRMKVHHFVAIKYRSSIQLW